jgi:alpha-methylacyl-CoA racemase
MSTMAENTHGLPPHQGDGHRRPFEGRRGAAAETPRLLATAQASQGGPSGSRDCPPFMPMTASPLHGVRALCIAIYVPALVAAQRLRGFGASVTVVEPPTGDPLAHMCRPWYEALHAGQTTTALDLKTAAGRDRLTELLATADLLITALRPAALDRLGLGWSALHDEHPRLCHVAIVGYPAPRDNEPGHDLTYQAQAGLLQPPGLPRSLIADLSGAERAAQAALALLVGRERGAGAARADVALSDGVDAFADPLRFGITAPGEVLGGGLPGYGLYAAVDGWVALAALEPHFWTRLLDALGVAAAHGTPEQLASIFRTRPALEWERWGAERDLPIVAVRRAPGGSGGDR